MTGLVPLPAHPGDVAWPTAAWPEGPAPGGWDLEGWIDELWADPAAGTTYAVAVAHRGRLVAERHGGALEHWDRPAEAVGPATRLLSWSVAKSVLHLAVGLLVGERRLAPGAPAPVGAWGAPGDPRGATTLEDLLAMRDGLDWVEDYDPASARSDVIAMLFGGEGATPVADVAAFAADRPQEAPPGTRYRYSSGTSNIVSGIVAGVVGAGRDYEAWLGAALLGPLGIGDARLTLDGAGTWVASSYLYLTARDWLRIGELALRDGVWEDRRLLPAGWVDHGRAPRSLDTPAGPDGPALWHGAHWWTEADELGTFWADGYEGQTVVVCPALDVVLVRFGRTPEGSPALPAWRRRVLARMAGSS